MTAITDRHDMMMEAITDRIFHFSTHHCLTDSWQSLLPSASALAKAKRT